MLHFPSPACPHARRVGFTLLELAIVLAIIALIAGGGMMVEHSVVANAEMSQTNTKLDTIEKALFAYRMANNRLPCPADEQLLSTDANYGVEAANSGSCIGGAPAADFSYANPKSGTNVVEGAVPVKALNLPNTFMYDGWGRKIAYAVWAPMTAASAFGSYSINNNCGAITIKDASHANRTTQADYALISYGADGYGGYLAGGTRYNPGSANGDEQTNAHFGAYAATYIQKDATANPNNSQDVFDDIVHYKERWQLQNASDQFSPTGGTPCTPGFVINGFMSNQGTGWSIASADVNGDHIPDLIIGAPNATPLSNGQSNAGAVFVVFGTKNGFPDPLPLLNLNTGNRGFELDGASSNSYAGWSVASGDVNGDTTADIVIGAYGATPPGHSFAGEAYVVFGGKTRQDGQPWSSCPCILSSSFFNSTSVNGVEYDGTANGEGAGRSVAVTDLNADTIPDVIVGAYHATSGSTFNAGSTFVIFGKKGVWSSTATPLDASLLNGVTGVEYDGAAMNAYSGSSLATGDVNDDNTGDLVIGAPASGTGSVYVVFGKATLLPKTTIDTKRFSVCAKAGTVLIASEGMSATTLQPGTTITHIGLSCDDGYYSCSGATCLQLSKPATADGTGTQMYVASAPLNASFLDGTNGVEFDGVATGSAYIGIPLAVGDVNGDSMPDLIIGSYNQPVGGNGNAGVTYVIFGKKIGWPTSPQTLNAAGFIDGINGVQFNGAASNINSGYSVATGDVNGDGIADLAIGAVYGASNKGAAYVFFGKNPLLPQTTITTKNGSASATVASTSGLIIGQFISASTLPLNTFIAGINDTAITLSSGAGVTAGNNKLMYVTSTPLNSTYLNGVYGSEFDGAISGDETGWAVGTCDLTGDGIPELIIGAPDATPGPATAAGSTYVFYGKKASWPSSPFGLGNL